MSPLPVGVMQVIYLHPHFVAEGGAGRMVLETAVRLAEHGHLPHVICIRADDRIVGKFRGKIQFHEIGGPLSSSLRFWLGWNRSVRAVLAVLDRLLCRDGQTRTILFPQVFPANWWGAVAARMYPQLPCVWYCQEPSAFIHSAAWRRSLPWPKNWIAECLRPILAMLDRRFCRRFRTIFVNSKFSLHSVRKVYGFSADECTVVDLGVDHNRFLCNPLQPRSKTILTVSRLTRFKNVDMLLKAAELLVRQGMSEIRLEIAGTGDALPSLRRYVAEHHLQTHVKFRERLSDEEIVHLMQSSRVFGLLSVDEPFGLVVAEALACGTPVVAVNSGGPAEIIGDSIGGQLVSAGNVHETAEALRHFLEMPDPDFLQCSSAAVEIATRFHWDRTTGQLESLFRSMPS